ncbi:homeobox-domain-containing protein [Cylindrobasidium torrendii FP15055 ss-10]|uniref:Homeobox-domain-containing protein n=1 Tax=Cylindrobasidium torrendii FP15055 ss-10 TaxID=1314674 RepID=A0A0D7BE29_9AGAR|nr:homeobox-domain-containing protein [Cylindrobasidium torrendii FP15055 ss-10]
MSDPRSPSHRRSNSPPNPSRTSTHDQPTVPQSAPRPTHSFVAATRHSTPAPSSSRNLRLPSSPEPTTRMSRSHRRPSQPESSERRDDSSDSQSQSGGMADTEEAEASHQSKDEPTSSSPPKKKRTRTLTTPHQAAVLHALLAQSRFPTTAMREEVGRSIGLSARKVQIWFQNQRQKARRPQTQQNPTRHSQNTGQASPSRPPQYGAYPTTTQQASSSRAIADPRLSSDASHTLGRSALDRHYEHPSDYGSYSQAPSPIESNVLLGPGIPGPSRSSGQSHTAAFYQRSSPGLSPTDSRHSFLNSPEEPYGTSPVEPTRSLQEYRPYVPMPRSPSPPPDRMSVSPPPIHGPSVTLPLQGRYIMRRTPSPSRTLPPPIPTYPRTREYVPWDSFHVSRQQHEISPLQTTRYSGERHFPRLWQERREDSPPPRRSPPEGLIRTRHDRPAARHEHSLSTS